MPTADHAALVEAIAARPADARPKMAYAEWLLSHNEPLDTELAVRCVLLLHRRQRPGPEAPGLDDWSVREQVLVELLAARIQASPSGAGIARHFERSLRDRFAPQPTPPQPPSRPPHPYTPHDEEGTIPWHLIEEDR